MATRIRYRPTSPTAEELINTQSDWVLLQLKKEGAGAVVIGENQELLPVDSGRSIELMEDTWTSVLLEPGTIWYVASPANEKIAVIQQNLPAGVFQIPSLLQRMVIALEKLAGTAPAVVSSVKPNTTAVRR